MIDGSEGAYRDGVIRCPSCGERMRQELTSSATIDVCDACGGSWIDWFDGDLQAIARETERRRRETPIPVAAPPPSPEARAYATNACPRCMRALAAEQVRFEDAHDSELFTGVDILRCSECAGAFVPRSSAHLLVDRQIEGRPLTLWEAIVVVLRRALGR